MHKKWVVIGVVTLLSIALLIWLFVESSKPPPGEKVLQDSRKHVDEGSKIDYKFNPPTSGDHYPSWIKKGFYDTPRSDGNLVHSLEHGYIIIWYDCGNKGIGYRVLGIVGTAKAQTIGMTGGSEGSPSASLESMPKAFSDGSCDDLKSKLKDLYQKDTHKLIVVPKVGMDHPVILTAWGRMEKLNNVDQEKIKKFINTYRDLGPERTDEP